MAGIGSLSARKWKLCIMGIGCEVRFDGGKGLTSGMVQVRVEGEGQE